VRGAGETVERLHCKPPGTPGRKITSSIPVAAARVCAVSDRAQSIIQPRSLANIRVPTPRGWGRAVSAGCRYSRCATGATVVVAGEDIADSLQACRRPINQPKGAGGGGGIRRRSASDVARRRRSSRRRLSLPRAIAQRWLAANTGRSSQVSQRSSGLLALTCQSEVIATSGPSWVKVHRPVPVRSPVATSA
jgi:hypothetical protein